jgi:tuberculosinol/isotuberculosinol synthase
MLEHGHELHENMAKKYAELTGQAYIDAYKLVFDHGFDNIVAPVFGSETVKRGEEYMSIFGDAVALLALHPDFIQFYKDYDIRVHVYGDYRKLLKGTKYEYVCDLCDEVTRQTAHHKKHALFYGVCADDATETIGEMAIKYYQNNGQVPSRRDLIEAYYGEYVEKADIFIGFEKFTVFDYPMLGWGMESLYYMAAPALYVNTRLLRNVLYDHIYLRPVPDADFFNMSEKNIESVRQYYKANLEFAFGIGEMRDEIWYAKSNTKSE